MARKFRNRIGQIEKDVGKFELELTPKLDARHHATAVAGIVLSGQPRIDEPLQHAWARTLQHHGIIVKEPESWADQVVATKQLFHSIFHTSYESAQFTQIFKNAPTWLLQFTRTALDARYLKFQLPDLSRKFRWGSAGYEDARRWPGLPLGRMGDGEPILSLDPRQLSIALLQIAIDEIPDDFETLPEEPRSKYPLLDDIKFALALGEVPEDELSRYQQRRFRRLAESISRL